MKEKISVSLEKSLIEQIDSLIDKERVRNRSQAIELIARNYFRKAGPLKAVILAGKAENSARILSNIPRILKKCREAEIKEIVIAASTQTPKLFGAINRDPYYSRNSMFVKEEKLLGTAGVLKRAETYLNSTFFVIYADIEFGFDLKAIAEFHKSHGFKATIALVESEKDGTDTIKVEGTKIIEFEYKKGKPTRLTNTGVYVFEPSLLSIIPSKGSLEREVFPRLAIDGLLGGFLSSEKWHHLE